jgi:hypothetical protein
MIHKEKAAPGAELGAAFKQHQAPIIARQRPDFCAWFVLWRLRHGFISHESCVAWFVNHKKLWFRDA